MLKKVWKFDSKIYCIFDTLTLIMNTQMNADETCAQNTQKEGYGTNLPNTKMGGVGGLRPPIFFILGAGASVDSNLPTYRGKGGFYEGRDIKPEEILTGQSLQKNPAIVWDFIKPLYEKIKSTKSGPTYDKLRELIAHYPGSFILTQNVDGFAKTIDVPVVEVHGNYDTMYCMTCGSMIPTNFDVQECQCGGSYRPNVVLFGEALAKDNVSRIFQLLKRRPAYTIIIGTTMQFPYLRTLVNKAKQHGSKVIHINPDPVELGKNEILIQKTASEGLVELLGDTPPHYVNVP